MNDIKQELKVLTDGETFTAGPDGAVVILPENTHADIVRYMIADIGADDVGGILAVERGK